MHHQVGSPLERVLQARRGKRAVHDKVRTPRVGLLGVVLNVEGHALRIDGGLEQDNVSSLQLFRRAVDIQLLKSGQARHQSDHAVAPMIAFPDGDMAGVEEHQRRVECGQTGGVGQGMAVQERGEDGFEPRRVRGGEAGVDV